MLISSLLTRQFYITSTLFDIFKRNGVYSILYDVISTTKLPWPQSKERNRISVWRSVQYLIKKLFIIRWPFVGKFLRYCETCSRVDDSNVFQIFPIVIFTLCHRNLIFVSCTRAIVFLYFIINDSVSTLRSFFIMLKVSQDAIFFS